MKIPPPSLLASLALCSLSFASAPMPEIPVNGGFEDGLDGWSASGNLGHHSTGFFTASEGTKLVVFNSGNLMPDGVLSQSFATVAGRTYTLAFDVGVISYNTNTQTMEVTVSGTGNLLSRSITLIGTADVTSRWQPQTFTFVADSAFASVTFRDTSTSTFALDLLLDAVRIDSVANPAPVASVVWKARYDAHQLTDEDDEDQDGDNNSSEAIAGTDPFDSMSRVHTAIGALTETHVRIDIASQPGKCYQVFSTPDLPGPWTPQGDPVCASAETVSIPAPRLGDKGFYRVGVSDRDSDGDGLTDWDEYQLAGFDPHNGDSFSSGIPGNDLTVAGGILNALEDGLLTIRADSPVAYENDGTRAIVTFTRTSSAEYPMTVFLKVTGAGDPAKSTASSGDFTFQDANGGSISRRLVIPAGDSSADLHVVPLADTLREVPEEVRISIGSSQGVTVTIRDAAPTLDNQTFLVANLRPIFGTGSVGSGVAVIRLPGDNDIAIITLSFSNLASPVSAIEVQGGGGTVFQSIPPTGYANHNWPIRAGGAFPTDQSVLDALLVSAVGLSIKTASRPNGEIEGMFIATNGSTAFQPPPAPAPAPAPVETLAGDELDRDIVRFLTQATFGPTMADVTTLRALVASHSGDRIAAFGEWIDQQFALPSPSLLEYVLAADRQEIEVSAMLPPDHPEYRADFDPFHHNRTRGWWLLARHAPDQLRQRAAFALSEIFVVSDTNPVLLYRSRGVAHFYDMLRSGASGTYRNLIEGMATHPVMGQYLSHLQNEKAVLDGAGDVIVSPDENFAREMLQLFSIGLVELHPDGSLKLGSDGLPVPTYGQNDIAELARVFTGWSFSVTNSPPTGDTVVDNTNFHYGNGIARHEAQWTHPMKMFPEYHDTGSKTVLGISIPAGQTGEQDLANILDHLASHPNTAPFIGRRLIQRFVTANPSAGYLGRVSNAFNATGGNLSSTIKAILLDPEARSLDTALGTSGFGKKREPLLRALAFLRAFDGKTGFLLSDLTNYGYPADELAKFPEGTTRIRLANTDYWLSQTPQSAPSVFNWFQPDHIPAGILAANGLTSPEMKLANEYSVFQETNLLFFLAFGPVGLARIPGQEMPPYNYPATANLLNLDITPLEALYLAVVDTNGDGMFTNPDIGTFGNTVSIAAACEAVVDRIDFLLCAGALKERYGDGPGKPRRIIIDAAASIHSANNGVGLAANQAAYMRDRIRNALWLVMSSPDFVIQK